jgi:predicted PurR-regulated permease PerM
MTLPPRDEASGTPGPPAAVGEAAGVRASPPRSEPLHRRLVVLAAMERPVIIGFAAALGVLGALVLGSALGSISTILAYIALALFLALGLDPIVRMLERRRIPRGAAIGIVFGVFCLLVVALLVFVLPPVVAQVGEFVAYIPEALADIRGSEWITGLAPDVQAALLTVAEQLRIIVSAPHTLAVLGGGVLAAVVGLVGFVTASFIVVALTLYFLASLSAMKSALYSLAPARNRPTLREMTERITASVGSALLGSVTLSAFNAAAVFVLHVLIGLPFPALMAAVAFVITLVPLFGSVIFLVLGSIVALFSSPLQALIFAAAYLVYIQLESYVISPRVMNRAVSIPAALVLIGALVGGTLMGVLGVLLALPVMASLLLIIHELVVPKQDLKV